MDSKPDYNSRYRVDKDELCKRVTADYELVSKFGVTISALDPGVILLMNDNRSMISINDAWWNWLRPLLEELSERRKDSVL